MSRQIKVGDYAYAWSGLDRVPELTDCRVHILGDTSLSRRYPDLYEFQLIPSFFERIYD